MVGRNDLCPCGSGRKYKKCCLAKDEAKEIAKNRILYATNQYESIIKKLEDFSIREEYNGLKEKCTGEFGLDEIDPVKTYYFCDYKYDKQSTILLDYFNENKDKINSTEKSIIENLMKSYASLYQIKEKDINKILLRDILLDENIYVEDINLFECFEAGNCVLGRIVNVGNTKIILDSNFDVKEAKIENIKKIIEKRFAENKKKFKDKKDCLLNNIRFMYKNISEKYKKTAEIKKEEVPETPIIEVKDSVVKESEIVENKIQDLEIEKIENNDKTVVVEEVCLTDAKEEVKKRVCEARIATNKTKKHVNKRLEEKLKERLNKTRIIQQKNQTNNISVNKENEINQNQETVLENEKISHKKINKKQKNNLEESSVYKLLVSKVELEYREKCINIWKKFLEKCEGYNGNEGGWVSALEYSVRKEVDESVTQEQISKKYGVSQKTLGKRYKELQGY